MISLRYHAVSIAAIFLALAVGVLLGASGVSDRLLGAVANQRDDLAGRVERLTSERDALAAQQRAGDEFAARVVHVIDQPLDEEGQTFAQSRIQGHEPTFELDAVGTCAIHRKGLPSGPSARTLDVVGAQAQRRGPITASRESPCHPRSERAGSGLDAVDDCHELDVAAAQGHDPVGGAVAGVAPARHGSEALLFVVPASRRVKVLDEDDHMVDGQHPGTIGAWHRARAAGRAGARRAALVARRRVPTRQ